MSDLNDTGTNDSQGSQGGDFPTWMDQLPDDYKQDEDGKGFATIGDLYKSFKDLKGKAEGAVKVPGEGATEEDVESFYRSIGKPEKPDEYEIKAPEGLEDLDLNLFRDLFHKNHLTKKQAEGLFAGYTELLSKALEEQVNIAERELEEAKTALKTEFGDKYNEEAEYATRALKQFGTEELQKALGDQVKSNPALFKFLAKIGRALAEDKIILGEKGGEKGIEATGQLEYEKSPELYRK